jgi:sortase A
MPASSKTIVRGWGAVLGLEDVRKAYDARRRASFRGRLLSVVSVALVVSGLVVVSVPVMLQSWSAGEQSATSGRLEETVADWPYLRAENELKEARAYNRDLASHGQYVLGEANDPFTQTRGSVSDKRYLSMLDAGEGVMGSTCPSTTARPNPRSSSGRATCTAAACPSEARARTRSSPGTGV